MINAFSKELKIENYSYVMIIYGEGLWILEEAIKQGTPTTIIGLSVMMRQNSLQMNNFVEKSSKCFEK
ncbi:hypothetical protein [Spiroplasma turonicum]|nr:hypothetical protein [Spiroplasma turonicum]